MKNLIIVSICTLIFNSCLKTTEEIEREKRVSEQLETNQKFSKDFLIELREFRSKIDEYNGRLQEIEHKQEQGQKDQQEKLAKSDEQIKIQVNALKALAEKNQKEISEISKLLNEQKKFISEITKSLKSLGSSSSKKKAEKVDDLKEADNLFSKKQYSKAKELYNQLLESKTLSAGKTNGVLLNVGIIEYKNKNYSDALVYLSKIYTKYPRSSKAPSALYHIGLCFKALGQKDEANETFKEVISKYANSSEAKAAKNELK